MRAINLSHLPLQALRCFEAAARHQSFKLAADELCLTPSAVSHQIKKLEDWIGNPLFLRKTRQIELTEIGRSLFDEISAAFRRMESSLEEAARHARKQPLRLAVPLVMQHVLQKDFIAPFQDRHPQYDLELISIPNAMSVPHHEILQQADVALLLGTGYWENTRAYPLISLHISAYCPASLAKHKFPLDDPRKLEQYRWLQNREFPEGWRWFLGIFGLSGLQSKVGTATYEYLTVLLEPSFKADGIALLDVRIAPYLLGNDWLRMLDAAPPSAAYCLVCLDNSEPNPGLQRMISFFTEQATRLGWPNSF
ncbi:MAG: transcriptional regulator [Proteobacteria bacterium]|nr:transcriptional regulator [Pseudomonadota bacterium]